MYLLAGWFVLGELALLLHLGYAWSQSTRAPAVTANPQAVAAGMPGAAAAVSVVDPFMSLLLAVLPVQPSQLGAAAIALQAAVYEGLYGAVAVALVSGSWLAWLVLWEGWLYCCYYSCTSFMHEQQKQQQKHRTQMGAQLLGMRPLALCLGGTSEHVKQKNPAALLTAGKQTPNQQPHEARQCINCTTWARSCGTGTVKQAQSMQAQLLVSAALLLMPVFIAFVAVWR